MQFDQIGRLPKTGDNVAIASRRLEAGTRIEQDDLVYSLIHTVLEGHRFACTDIAKGHPVLSWGFPFGTARCDIAAGAYICNDRMLTALSSRDTNFNLPDQANFEDRIEPYDINVDSICCGSQVERYEQPGYFRGFDRGDRGVGTRNYIVVLATSSLTNSFVRALVGRFRHVRTQYPQVDGVVAVAHTEGGQENPNNLEFVLRSLAGFIVHPNVAAMLAVDFGTEPIHNDLLRHYLSSCGYPISQIPHRFLSLGNGVDLDQSLNSAETVVRSWIKVANNAVRRNQPLSRLKLALQCGGSDAFSGICGNPLAGWMAREIIRHGGAANLAETDELIGAEAYILQNVRDRWTAEAFLRKIELFKQRVAWHGHDAEGNVSGGNRFRGLYNVVIKSIGAARKKDPQVRLDFVIDYSERMQKPGFYFMDSPGNDLESVAGQVASGANLILFTTGNGSITNFPFVPTIKIITTTGRYRLVSDDMDINAGRYQDGIPLDELGRESFDLVQRIASGDRSAGERAGHAQVQLWRNWQKTGPNLVDSRRDHCTAVCAPNGQAISVRPASRLSTTFVAYCTDRGFATDQVAAIVPTSLCSGQIARLMAEQLNDRRHDFPGVSRFVSFTHTEGCGVSGGSNERLYVRTLIGHAAHRMVRVGLFLEHGCEKTHNEAMHNYLSEYDISADRFGWASVQLDGGIEQAGRKVNHWFEQVLAGLDAPLEQEVGLDQLRLGVLAVGTVPDPIGGILAELSATIVTNGGTVVIPCGSDLMRSRAFCDSLFEVPNPSPSLDYGQAACHPGCHLMATPTEHAVEILTGLAATGVDLILAGVHGHPLQVHPMVPVIQISSHEMPHMDLAGLSTNTSGLPTRVLDKVLDVASRRYTPMLVAQGYHDFQMTRGLLGVSL